MLTKEIIKDIPLETWFKCYASKEVFYRRLELLKSIRKWNNFYNNFLSKLPRRQREKIINGEYNGKKSHRSKRNRKTRCTG